MMDSLFLMTRTPGRAATSTGRRPLGGNRGKDSPGGTGIASVLPALESDSSSTTMYRNFPSGDHVTMQKPRHILRGSPPAVGTAKEANPAAPPGSGRITAIQRRSAGIFCTGLIGYGIPFARPLPSRFIL